MWEHADRRSSTAIAADILRRLLVVDYCMVISNGIVEIGADGVVTNIDFRACHITVGPNTKLSNCNIDERCELVFSG